METIESWRSRVSAEWLAHKAKEGLNPSEWAMTAEIAELRAALAASQSAPVAAAGAHGVWVGTISSGDIDGDEIDWDAEFDRKVVDALPQLRVPNQHFGLFMAPLVAAQPPADAAPVDAKPVDADALRAAGRAEALAILMQLDPEAGIDDYTGWSTPMGPEDEGAAYWDAPKLRELFSVDSALADMMDRAEGEYWHYKGLQDEAERAKNFAANILNSGKVRDVLAKAGEFDLMARLCSAAQPSPAQGDALIKPPQPVLTDEQKEVIRHGAKLLRLEGYLTQSDDLATILAAAQQPDSERDAARMEWLEQQNACLNADKWLVTGCDFPTGESPERNWVGVDLRGAIDAAMAAQQGEKGGAA